MKTIYMLQTLMLMGKEDAERLLSKGEVVKTDKLTYLKITEDE